MSPSLISQSIFKTHLFNTKNGRTIRISSNRIQRNASNSVPTAQPTRPGNLSSVFPRIIGNIYISSKVRHHSILSRTTVPPLLRHNLSPMSSLTDGQPSTPTARTVRVVVKGRVQGVFYRNWTIENARELGLKGWVRNRRDGSVEALFSGSPNKVHEMEERCRRGPPAAMVTAFEVSSSTDDPGSGFERRQTV